ncbi:MAG: kelch repeat-containing protein [Caldilineaceae bacterium]
MSTAQPNEPIAKHDTPKHGVPLIQDGRLLENPLSEREMEVARLLSTGASNGEIAHTLIISPHTVKVHLRNIFEKLQVSSRTEASMLLVQRGWLTVPGVEIPPAPEATPIESTPIIESEIPPSPDPQPLVAVPFALSNFQRFYFVTALFGALIAFFLPSLRGRATASPSLLTDAGQVSSAVAEVQPLSRWQFLTALPEPRSRMALALLGEQLVTIGGETTGGRLVSTVDAYDMRLNDWRKQIDLPVPLSNSAATVISETIFVAGGTEQPIQGGDPQVSNQLLRWHKGDAAWSTLGELPNRLVGASLVADSNSLYLIGGWDGDQMHSEVWRLAVDGQSKSIPNWQLVTKLDVPRAFLGAAIIDNKLYVIGGSDGQHNSNLTKVYDLTSNQWKALAPLPTPRHGFSLVYDGSALYVMGGDETNPSPIHQRYDISTNEWTNIPSPVQGVWRHLGAVSTNGRIYVIGGWSGDYLDVALEYQSSYRLLLPVISKDQ